MTTQSSNGSERPIHPDADMIIVGGGHASADAMPFLCEKLGDRVRGVVFIDHDRQEIGQLQVKIRSMGVRVQTVALAKRQLERARFESLVEEAGMTANANWEDDLNNHPPGIKFHIRMREEDIERAVWDMLPTQGGVLTSPRVNIVFLFGFTGMTSATVAIEGAAIIRERINKRLGGQSAIDESAPRHFGIGLFPPNPHEGAGDFNLQQGINVARQIERVLPEPNASPREIRECAFDKLTLIDGSGFGRTQNLEQFDEWASRTISTLLTCKAVTGQSFFDLTEMLNDLAPFQNAALVMAGGGPDQQAQVDWLNDFESRIGAVIDGKISGIELNAAATAMENESPQVDSQSEIQTQLDGLKEDRLALVAAYNAHHTARSAGPGVNKWFPLIGFSTTFVVSLPVLYFVIISGVLPLFSEENRETAQWLMPAAIALGGAVVGVVGAIIGFATDFVLSRMEQNKIVAAAENALRAAENAVRNRLAILREKIRAESNRLGVTWRETQNAKLWVMPDSDDPALPLPQQGESTDSERNRAVADINQRMQGLVQYAINPIPDVPLRVGKGKAVICGSPTAQDLFPLPEDAMNITFECDWEIRPGEGDISDDVPIHYLLLWEPEDGKITPRFYRNSDISVSQLPPRYNAWPQQQQQA